MGKINGKVIFIFIIWLLIIGLLVYSRYINLGWGFPYPMHPDERNMATAIQQLDCQLPVVKLNLPQSIFGNWEPVTSWLKITKPLDVFNCFNPHFFAYGQFPLYLGYLIIYFLKFFDGDMGFPISFQEAAMSLRIISAVASIINVFILIKIIELISNVKHQSAKRLDLALCALIFALTPYAVQLAHFGTTESILMLFYSAIIYISLLLINKKINTLSFVVKNSMLIGLSMATKVSSLIFLIAPFLILLFNKDTLKEKTSVSISKNSIIFFGYRLISKVIDLIILLWITLIIFIIFSPHNLINFKDFISSLNYESEVALGKSLVFYTRQFFETKPILFQIEKIFPYALGWPIFILGSLGFFWLSWKDKSFNLLRFAFLVYFIPSAMIYAKWSRFMAPVLPLLTTFAILFILNIKDQILKLSSKFKVLKFALGFALCALIFAMIIPGLAYLSIYQKPDVRFQASDWIYKNIPEGSQILFETANVVDVPIPNPSSAEASEGRPNYQTVSFNFYDLDISPQLQNDLQNYINKADYIFVPSRRIFANHPEEKYPLLNQYYKDLYSGKLGFEKVAEFDSYPQINFQFSIFNFQWKFPDEEAEETWTVFDHPVIRIYRKVKS